jgi:hypothetical protein
VSLDLLPASFVTTQAELDALDELDMEEDSQQHVGAPTGGVSTGGQQPALIAAGPRGSHAGDGLVGVPPPVTTPHAEGQQPGPGTSEPTSVAHVEDFKAQVARLKAAKSKKGGNSGQPPPQGPPPSKGSKRLAVGAGSGSGVVGQHQGGKGGQGAGGGGSVWGSLAAACSHLPHPGSGCVRDGRSLLSPEPPALFSALTSLVSMALLVKVRPARGT